MINLLGLVEMFNTYGHSNVYHEVATTLLNNYRRLDKMNMNQIAELCNVSPSTLARFFKKLDYPMTVSKLPEIVAVSKINYANDGFYTPVRYPEQSESIEGYFRELHLALTQFEQLMAGVDFDLLIDQLYQHKHLVVLGCPMPQEVWRFHVDLALTEITCEAFFDPSYQYEAIQRLNRDAVVLFFDFEFSSVIEYQQLLLANMQWIKHLVIVTNKKSPTLYCHQAICFEGTGTEQDFILTNLLMNLMGIKFRQRQSQSL